MLIDVIVIAVTAAQLTTLTLWLNARARANDAARYLALFNAAMDELRELDRTAVKRDPKTGRYLKKGN